MREYLLVALIAVGVTYLLSGLARRLAFRYNAVAMVRDRDVHTKPVPYFGGVAMWFGLAAAFLVASQLPWLGSFEVVRHDATAVLVAGGLICLVGAVDDVVELGAVAKIAGQLLAAGVAVMNGVKVYWIPLPDAIVSLDEGASIVVTVLLIFFAVNAVNLIDGLDGLAAGVVAVGAGAFFTYAYLLAYQNELARATTSSLVTVATVGICLGFLPYNIHKARMFMGDSGAMLLGLLMAMSAISYTGQLDSSTLVQGSDVVPALLPILLPVAALALPLVDLIMAWIRRSWNGQHPFAADKQHLHHRLLARGHSHWGAVLLMYGWAAVVSVGLVAIALTPAVNAIWIVVAALAFLVILTVWPVRTAPAKLGGAEADVVDKVGPDE